MLLPVASAPWRKHERTDVQGLRRWDGRPDNPEKSGWHWIEDADGLRPLLWRGDDWPKQAERGEWQDGYAVLSASDLSRGCYYGPVDLSPCLIALHRRKLFLPDS